VGLLWRGAIVTATVDATVRTIVAPTGHAATIVPCAKTHCNRTAGHEFDGISEANNTTSIFGDVSKTDWRRYCGQNCRSVGKLLHFPSWNVSWLNS